MPAKPAVKRPLSPHLSIYKPQLTSIMSILHRATGIWLALGLPVVVAWLVALASGPRFYQCFVGIFLSPVGQIALLGWTWAFFYHFCTGVRHLLWDAGFFLTIKGVYSTGRIALGISTLATIGVWLEAYGWMP